MNERDQRVIVGLFYDGEGFLREDVHAAIREAVRSVPPVIDAKGWIGSVQIVHALLDTFGVDREAVLSKPRRGRYPAARYRAHPHPTDY